MTCEAAYDYSSGRYAAQQQVREMLRRLKPAVTGRNKIDTNTKRETGGALSVYSRSPWEIPATGSSPRGVIGALVIDYSEISRR